MATITESITSTLQAGSLKTEGAYPPHDVETILNYYQQSADGSPPAPFIVG